METIKNMIQSMIGKLGYKISRKPQINANPDDFYSDLSKEMWVVDRQKVSSISCCIPGMITADAGCELFSLCYMQQEKGDVVEIGCWQGRSTSFLARAVIESKNGRMIVVDHFKGNAGEEHFYIMKENDLSDLEEGFLGNMSWAGCSEPIELLNMSSAEAAGKIEGKGIRFLFIDGDHTLNGVEMDLSLFEPRLTGGAIVVFDDYTNGFPGVVEAANNFIKKVNAKRKYLIGRTLVIRI
jgi:predicted O-methyltransferase YrrM